MAIYTCLSGVEIKSRSAEQGICDFNGYVEDYLLVLEEQEGNEEFKEFLNDLVEKEPSIKICVNLGLDINPKVVTNRIIRYKDAFKLPKGKLVFPYLIYGQNTTGEERAMILVEGGKDAYLKAKGLYYCLTEPMGMVENARNEIIAFAAENYDQASEVFQELFLRNVKTGIIQRKLDRDYFKNYDELKEYCLSYANELKDQVREAVAASENKDAQIYEHIIRWFLIKKVLYVQYMMNKQILAERHNGDIKEQRGMAKKNADEIPFVSFSEMWKL